MYVYINQMSDQTYDFTRKLRFVQKSQDFGFTIKYLIEIDPNDDRMKPVSKVSQGNIQLPKQKPLSYNSQPENKNVSSPFRKQQFSHYQPKQDKRERRNKRMKKILQFRRQDAELFNNYTKLNRKNMKIRKTSQDEHSIQQNKDKKGKKKRERGGRKVNQNPFSQSQEELGNLYNYLATPQNRRRVSNSIDNTQVKQQMHQKTQQKYKKFYQQKKNKKIIYPPYSNLEEIIDSREIKQKRYFKGIINFSERVKNYAQIFSKQIEGELIVEGINKNRCIHGDQVYFQLLQKEDLPKQKDTMEEKIRCKVVYILPWKKNQKRQVVGKIQFSKSNNTYYLIPINKRIIGFDVKFSEISKQNLRKFNEKYFLAQFTEWKDSDEYPSCRLISQYGTLGQIQTETGALLINNGVEDKQYEQQTVQKGLQKFIKNVDQKGEYKITDEEIKKRSDLRQQRIFTIDPLTAKDFDDALSIKQCGKTQQGEKIYEIGVHIADASFFVEEDGLIDQIAQQKTTSVYLVHRVLPMLPRILCQTMCSLNPGLQRLTLSVWFKLTQEGTLMQGSRYDRSVIKSRARFTYEQAQKIIDKEINSQKQIQLGFGCTKESDFDQIASDLRIMNSIAQKVRAARIKGGSLIFQTPKKSFKLDQKLYPQSFTISQRFQANFLVQQYMLLANQKVGQILVQNIRQSALLRRHKFPSDKKIQKFQKFTLKINQPMKITKQLPMQQQMNSIMKNPKIKKSIKEVLNYEMIFLLQQAEYFIVGDSSKQQWLHYALNMGVYTHFTSPIRRYPDIMVHRQLIAIIQAKKNNIEKEKIVIPNYKKLKQLVDRCNKNKMSAKKVSSGCDKIFLCLYLKTHSVFCKAVLTDLNQYCLSICVPSYDFRSAIQFKQLKKAKPLEFSKDSSERKNVQLQVQYELGKRTKILLKQMQQIDVKLTAKQGFPIDYMITLMFPHPKNPLTSIPCE